MIPVAFVGTYNSVSLQVLFPSHSTDSILPHQDLPLWVTPLPPPQITSSEPEKHSPKQTLTTN
jgi:hypothetical protein